MVSRSAQTLNLRIVTSLAGDELFSFEYGGERWISAKDLRTYLGGDTSVPSFFLEAGARAQRVSDLPNAEGPMGAGDLLTGLQAGRNVNFNRAQLLASLLDVLTGVIDERIVEALAELGYVFQSTPGEGDARKSTSVAGVKSKSGEEK
jgi:hypothetical protein